MTTEHNAAAGEYCPACHSLDYEGGFVEIEPQGATQECFCNECGAEWIDHYKIDRVEMIRTGYDPTEEQMRPGQGVDQPDLGRAPTDLEAQAIVKIFEGYLPGIIVVYDHYISDGPGYAGWLAVTVSGEPQFCATFTQDSSGQIELCGQVSA